MRWWESLPAEKLLNEEATLDGLYKEGFRFIGRQPDLTRVMLKAKSP
jgi:hypothetical protein